ncbi:ABC transporter permease [Patescibacteria group bacterium]|nr:ABC transporter permease [Patescibacteria group bacterium]
MLNHPHHYLELLLVMTQKEIRARYKYTMFGFLWMIINPLLQMLIIGTVFTFFIKEPVAHYYFHLFIGLLVWNFFSLSLNKTTPSIVNERVLIKKSRFPRTVIPLSIILSNFIHFFLSMLLYTVAVLFIGTFDLHRLPALVLGLYQLIVFSTGLSLLTAALNVRYRDVNFFVQAFLNVWFYATPIIYSLSMIPRSLLWIWRFNPLTSTLQLFQLTFLGEPAPGLFMLSANFLVIAVVTVAGAMIFRKESKNFDDWL